MNEDKNYLITGGCGQLGRAIIELLLKKDVKIRVLDLQYFPNDGVESIVGDICDMDVVREACKGIDVVFHTAAAVVGNNKKLYYKVNVEGTKNIIKACQELNVSKLIYTSSFDVVMNGKEPMNMADESLPYPKKYLDRGYSLTKRMAEQEIIKANGPSLSTCVLRATGMFGLYDKYHLPPLLKNAKKNKGIMIGDGKANFSHVFNGNVAHAHILASEKLFPESPVCGQCYFIADHDNGNFFNHLGEILELMGYKKPTKSIPYWLTYSLGWFCDKFHINSNLSRFAVIVTTVERTVSYDKAARDFGYKPLYSREEALNKTAQWFKENYE